MVFITSRKLCLAIFLLGSVLAASGCADLQPPSASGPRTNDALYPILLTADSNRKEAVAAALTRLTSSANGSTAPAELQPVTSTVLSLPQANSSFYLPKIGATGVMSEEETRESLRRFIREWRDLIGADPATLSLVERIDQPDGSKLANYEQRPFRYPLRGNYGKLQIHFASDRRIINLTSSCIPDAERIQASLPSFSSVRLRSREAAQQLRDNGLVYTDAKGNNVNSKLPASSVTKSNGLVVYIRPAKSQPEALEFHLAWETELSNSAVKFAYVDAMSGELIGVE